MRTRPGIFKSLIHSTKANGELTNLQRHARICKNKNRLRPSVDFADGGRHLATLAFRFSTKVVRLLANFSAGGFEVNQLSVVKFRPQHNQGKMTSDASPVLAHTHQTLLFQQLINYFDQYIKDI